MARSLPGPGSQGSEEALRAKRDPADLSGRDTRFRETFISLQSKRHLADYDPDAPFGKTNVIEDIDEARDAIARFLQAPLRHRRAFAIYLLTKLGSV